MTSLDFYPDDRPRQHLRQLYLPDRRPSIFQNKLRKAFPPHSGGRFAASFDALGRLGNKNGDVDYEPASQWSIDHAREILLILESENLEPIKTTSAAEGGIAFCFANQEKYASIECQNSKEILG